MPLPGVGAGGGRVSVGKMESSGDDGGDGHACHEVCNGTSKGTTSHCATSPCTRGRKAATHTPAGPGPRSPRSSGAAAARPRVHASPPGQARRLSSDFQAHSTEHTVRNKRAAVRSVACRSHFPAAHQHGVPPTHAPCENRPKAQAAAAQAKADTDALTASETQPAPPRSLPGIHHVRQHDRPSPRRRETCAALRRQSLSSLTKGVRLRNYTVSLNYTPVRFFPEHQRRP